MGRISFTFMPSPARLHLLATLLAALALCSSACAGGVFKQEYEYEEELYLAVDGSATLNVNASVPALVALHGVDLDVRPRARFDRARVRELFTADGAAVTRVSASRRDGRRFVHVTVRVNDVRQLQRVAPLSWSSYRFEHQGDVIAFTQTVGRSAGKPVGDVGWTGRELVAFRVHLPSEIDSNNSPRPVQRGNILEWEQPLADRMTGQPLTLEVAMEPSSILYSTLLLFGATIVAAAAAFAIVIWWVARRGRDSEMAESRP
jgi:hypothetical protein